MIGCVLTVVTATAVAAPTSAGPVDDSVALWVGEPIAINPVDTALLERVGLQIREALAAAIPGRILYGSELLSIRNRAHATSTRSRLASARDLLKEGEDNYISFNFAPAAASLAEAAGLFAAAAGSRTPRRLG